MIEVHGLLTHNTCREEWGSRWETSFCLFAFPVCYLIPPCKLHTRVTDPCSESFYRERRRDRWKGLPSAGPQCSELSWSESGHQELLLGHTGGYRIAMIWASLHYFQGHNQRVWFQVENRWYEPVPTLNFDIKGQRISLLCHYASP